MVTKVLRTVTILPILVWTIAELGNSVAPYTSTFFNAGIVYPQAIIFLLYIVLGVATYLRYDTIRDLMNSYHDSVIGDWRVGEQERETHKLAKTATGWSAYGLVLVHILLCFIVSQLCILLCNYFIE